MSASSPESALLAVYQQYARSGLGGDLRFVDAVFTLLRKNTTLLNTEQSIAQVQKLAIKHCEIGKKERAEKKKKEQSQSSSQSTGQSSTQSTNPSSDQSINQSSSQSESQATSQTLSDAPPVTSHQPSGEVPINNGGKTDRYTWSQTLSDVTCILSAKLPSTMTAKQLNVSIDADRVNVTNKLTNDVLLSGEWHSRIHADDATWTLELDSSKQSKVLSLYLPKADRMQWWASLMKGDVSIDVTKIVPENSQLSDLDTDTRKTVEKMMFDQRAKQSGQKTSDEITKEQALKRFMDLHPEMDFSQAKML